MFKEGDKDYIYIISDDVLATQYGAPSFLSTEFLYPPLQQ